MVIDLARDGRIKVDTRVYPLDDGERAFADLEEGRVRGRAVRRSEAHHGAAALL